MIGVKAALYSLLVNVGDAHRYICKACRRRKLRQIRQQLRRILLQPVERLSEHFESDYLPMEPEEPSALRLLHTVEANKILSGIVKGKGMRLSISISSFIDSFSFIFGINSGSCHTRSGFRQKKESLI